MPAVPTNKVAMSYAREATPGVLPGSPVWKLLEPNTIPQYGAELGKVSRTPISSSRQRRKGTITDLDSGTQIEADLTLDSAKDFFESFLFAQSAGPIAFGPLEVEQVTAVTGTDSYTVTDNGDLVAGTLVYARGFTNAANNGVKTVDTGSTTTDVPVVETLVAEASPPTEAMLEVCGVEGATGDIDVDANGNLTSTALDFTTLGLTVGQVIWVGGVNAANQFTNAENSGFARITAIAANLLSLDKKSQAFVTEADTTQNIHLFFGKFIRNVADTDSDYLERTFHFEGLYPDLFTGPADGYEYSTGNLSDVFQMNFPLTDKATATFGFVGLDVEVPTTTRKTGAATPVLPIMTTAINTTADFARLRVTEADETGITTNFKDMTVTLDNNVEPEKVLGTLGAAVTNVGFFFVDIETQALFESPTVLSAIRNNDTVTMDFAMRNEDGGFFVDIPSMTLGDGGKEFPLNEIIKINVTAEAFGDLTFGYSIGVSMFPFLPSS